MLSTLSSLFNLRSQAKQYQTTATILDTNARGTRKAAAAQAANIEQTARANHTIAGENLMRGRTNQRAALAEVQADRFGASRLSGGTTEQPIANLRRQLDTELANIAQSASIASINAWQGALDTRRKGEIEAYKLEAQAAQYRSAAHSINDSITISAITSTTAAAAGAYLGYQNANTAIGAQMNTLHQDLTAGNITETQYLQQRENLLNSADSRMWSSAYNTASQLGSAAFDITNSFNPYTAALEANPSTRKNNYGGAYSVLMGNIPYRIPNQNALYTYIN